jgi:ADP-dependent NAD(P)H-hydrate dehydratase / NAD(P)H-hydrate epimerase
LNAAPHRLARPHASHKGSYGDVAVIGGAPGMTGAAFLAATAALHAGAGRVFACLLDDGALSVDLSQPDLMLRRWDSLALTDMAVACGCGGGDAVRSVLPKVLSTVNALVLDADALNAIAGDTQLQTLLQARARRERATVLTPHPLEAGRLLGCSAAQVQADRLRAARELSDRFGCVVALKGSGTVIAMPGCAPRINPTGNGRLATAGTGDVLAGMIAARLAMGADAFEAACAAVYEHGAAADRWPADRPLTAAALARRV